MSLETIMTIFGPIITFVAMVGGMIALYVSLRRPIVELDKKFEKKFDQVEKRFDQIDARFDQIGARFDQIDARFDKVDAAFDGLADSKVL
ncbi:hypothetical protein [Leucobacter denitrificans]|uniref:Uncharacterized protein n=1 Tax=Leucobacter denitrificans TaxID=683042 RepID=A0A7G9S779_9MICO|nr:hypothetical protein [Leucobacter denitrificans]QNN63704.1 hypothetical protein H9L06_05285 [Leucobacter denitrificans]